MARDATVSNCPHFNQLDPCVRGRACIGHAAFLLMSGALPDDPSSPLGGIAVIEIGHSVAAPFAGQILADLGAPVLKIENPRGGGDARNWVPPVWYGTSAVFQTLNRNKYSVAIDLKASEGRDELRRLIADSDVL